MRKLFFLILTVGFFNSSCDDFLDVTPPSEYVVETYYKTPEDFETAISGCYEKLMDIYSRLGNAYMNAIILRGDECKYSSDYISRFMDESTDDSWEVSWKSLWKIVHRSNMILDRIDSVEFENEEQRDNIKGEALALRGFAYFQFAWCWGGTPIITNELPLEQIYMIPRSSQTDTYAQAEQDFLMAFDLLPEKWEETKTGRVTKYAAAGMLGRLYLYQKRYEDAKSYLAKVIEKENVLYKIAENYEDCFDDAFNNSGERVWEVQYLGGASGQSLGLSQTFSSWFIPANLNLEKGDGGLMNGVKFAGPTGGTIYVSLSLAGDGVYEYGDKRRDATIATGLYLDKSEPITDQYFCKKFTRSTGNPPLAVDYWGNNLPILRYTDVKLMYAEVLNELNYSENITEILSILNEVRARAGLDNIDDETLPDKEAVFEYLVRERFVEFCFEGIRWPDLLRWGLAEKMMEAHFSIGDEGYNSGTGLPAYSMQTRNLLAPIPYIEIMSYNNEEIMWQNPGY